MNVKASEGERFVYQVESKTVAGKFYRVDLTNLGGYSACSCRDWEMRRSKAIAQKMPMGTRATCCIHVQAARNYFTNEVLKQLSKREERP